MDFDREPDVRLGSFRLRKCAGRLRWESVIRESCALVDEPVDGNWRKESLDSLLRHHRDGFATECDGLEDLPFAHTIGNASHLAPGFHGRVGDKFRAQASTVTGWLGSQSKRHLHFFKELFPLWLRKTNDQPSEGR